MQPLWIVELYPLRVLLSFSSRGTIGSQNQRASGGTADALVLGTSSFGSGGSNPPSPTTILTPSCTICSLHAPNSDVQSTTLGQAPKKREITIIRAKRCFNLILCNVQTQRRSDCCAASTCCIALSIKSSARCLCPWKPVVVLERAVRAIVNPFTAEVSSGELS
jgi:hypothetical protein